MYKKLLIVFIILFITLCFYTFSFATSTDNVKNSISGVTNSAVDGVDNLGRDVRNGVGAIENGVENAFNSDNKGQNNLEQSNISTASSISTTNAAGYTTARTSADVTGAANTTTMWTWVILAIAAIVIVGLVWYYASQDNKSNNRT